MSLPFVCKQEDDFTFEKPRWIAHLSNGEKVLQDDDRPGVEPKQAWLRLKDYCGQTGIDVVNLTLQFRSNQFAPLPANARAYFFCNRIVTAFEPTALPFSLGFHLVGYVLENKVHVQHWKIPEYTYAEDDVRNVEDSEYYLIWRKDAKQLGESASGHSFFN